MQCIKLEIEKRLSQKRESQRLDVALRVQYGILSGRAKKNGWQETFSHDISGGGIKLRLDFSLEKGNRLDTLIYFPGDSKPVHAIVKVVWCKRMAARNRKIFFDIGTQYMQMKTKDKERFILLFCEMMVDYFVLSEKERRQNIQEKREKYDVAASR
jgi:c-di-GMP-binding flagellar brake protein YcgR